MPTAAKAPISAVISAATERERRVNDRIRGSARERGYTAQWDKARATWLAEHPLCAECNRRGLVEPATLVDHIEPHKGDMVLFWDVGNWQSLCRKCHAIKTAKENGEWRPAPANAGAVRCVTVVWGPPGAGKSTYVKEHKQDGDIVLDVDMIASALLGGARMYKRSRLALGLALDCRELLIARIADPAWIGTAWVVTTTPSTQDLKSLVRRLKASLVQIVPDVEECKRRIIGDDRPKSTNWVELVDKWYESTKARGQG